MTLAARAPHPRFLLPSALALTALALGACGGGGGGGGGGGDPGNDAFVAENCQALIEEGIFDPSGVCTDALPADDVVTDEFGDDTIDVAESDEPSSPDTDVPLVPGAEPGPELADVPGSDFYAVANNTARLQGPVYGDGTVANASLSRSLPFRVGTTETGLEMLHASVVPRGTGGSTVLMVVANRSAETRCFVKVEGYALNDASGQPIERVFSLGFNFADGAVGTSGFLDSQTCIGPGSLAYMIDLVVAPTDVIASVTADSLSSQRSVAYDLVETVVEPLSYTLDVDDVVPITFLVANRGLVDVEVKAIVAMLLDEQGFPVGALFGFDEETFAPGEERGIELGGGGFAGAVSTIRVIIDFERDGF